MIANTDLTADRLHELLIYDPVTGVFTWRISRGHVPAGARAGSRHQHNLDEAGCGYRRLGVDGRYYMEHRLVWLYVNGEWPRRDIDHVNGVRDDNRIANLREATPAQNNTNLARANRRSTSGYLGVQRHHNGWCAEIKVNGKRHRLGHFATAAEAHEVYVAAKRELHPFWARERAS